MVSRSADEKKPKASRVMQYLIFLMRRINFWVVYEYIIIMFGYTRILMHDIPKYRYVLSKIPTTKFLASSEIIINPRSK